MTPSSWDTSKLAPPLAPPALVQRPRLHQRLDEAVQGPLTLIAAGPGAGKTVLLSSWAASSTVSTAWVSLDARDDDPARLWALVAEALIAAGSATESDGSGPAVPSQRHPAGDDRTAGPSSTAGLPRALQALSPTPGPHVLILDDAHHLRHPTVLAELDALIRYDFLQLRLVLSTRSDPLLPLHRYRLAGRMQELRAADLAMTKAETDELMAAHGVKLSARDLALLRHRTEGWTAGLRLSAMTLSRSEHPEAFVSQLGLGQGSVGEYLMEEVLGHQTDDVRRLLIQTSFLDELTGPLAVAVTDITESSALLAELSRTNSFVVRIDHPDEHYRYHQLMKEILSHLLTREFPGQIGELRRRAAQWYQSEGDSVSALRFAADAGDWSGVCQILIHGGFGRAFVDRRDFDQLGLGPLAALAPDEVAADGAGVDAGEVLLAQAAVGAMTGDLERVNGVLRRVRAGDLGADAALVAGLVQCVFAYRSRQVPELDQAADRLLDSELIVRAGSQPPGLRAAIRLGQAAAHYWEDNEFDEAERLGLVGLADARSEGVPALELEALGLLQLIHISNGKAARAQECDDESRSLIRSSPHLHLMTFHHLARAWGGLMRSDMASADRALRRAEQSQLTDADPHLRAAVVIVACWVQILSGSIADAYQLLQSSPALKIALPARMERTVALTLADVETRLGRPTAALRSISDEVGDPVRSMMAARAALDLGDADAAEQALRPVLIATQGLVALPLLVYALLLSARVAVLRGDEAKAVAEIVRASALASDTIVQPFVGAQEHLEGVLARHAEARDAWPKNAKLDVRAATPTTKVAFQLAEPLTERETTVLRRLVTNMTIAEIADELCVSTNTVKTHVSAVYRKLPAASRRDAVARARQLELL